MSLLGFLFGDSKSTTTTTSNTQQTVNTTDSYNTSSTLNQTLVRNDSYVNAPTTNTALDYVNTYNLANVGNITPGDVGGFARFASGLDLTQFFKDTQPNTPNSSRFDWTGNSARSTLEAVADLQGQTLAGQAANTNAAANAAGATSGSGNYKWLVAAAIAAIIALAAFLYFRRK